MKKRKKEGLFEQNMPIRHYILLLLACIGCLTVEGQVDSLKKIYPHLKGKERVQALIDISYYQSLSNPEESKRFGKMAEKEAHKLGDSSMLATVWNDWSIVYFYAGELDSSLLLNRKAYHYRQQLRDTLGMAKSLNKIASTYYEMGLHDKCLRANLTSLSYFEQLGQEQYFCQVYTNIGNVYDRINQPELAMKYHARSIVAAQKIGNLDAEVTSRINIANSYRVLGKVQKAREEYLNVIPKIERLERPEYLAGVYQGLGVLEREAGNLDAGIAYYEKSLAKYREVGAMSGVTLVAVNLGNAYLDKKEFERAEKYFNEGLTIALTMHSHYNIRHAYKGLTRLENLKGNFERADLYFDRYVAHMDSIYNEESTKAISEMQVKYETEQKDKLLAQAALKEKNATILLLAAGGSILVLLILVGWVVQRRKLDRKNAAIRNFQNLERERSRIARDLHDNLGAELTMITSKLDMKSFRTTMQADKDDLDEIGAISRNANHVLRETIWSIHKEHITIDELHRKAKEYTERILSDTKIEYSVECTDKETVLSPSLALHLFRIIQESVNNAFKYSECTVLTIDIRSTRLVIKDNGKGFDLAHVVAGYGLQNMQQRTNEFGGQLLIKTAPGEGTEIFVSYIPSEALA